MVLVLGAWNFPLHLTLAPVLPAIAAGNCVVMKPSEIALASAALLEELIPAYLDRSCVVVVNGGVVVGGASDTDTGKENHKPEAKAPLPSSGTAAAKEEPAAAAAATKAPKQFNPFTSGSNNKVVKTTRQQQVPTSTNPSAEAFCLNKKIFVQ